VALLFFALSLASTNPTKKIIINIILNSQHHKQSISKLSLVQAPNAFANVLQPHQNPRTPTHNGISQ